MNLIDPQGNLWCALKILTDYPRDDLAHDEVHQALLTACVKRKIMTANIDVGAITGLDTVAAGFKTAQLAMNSDIGFGHIFHTNCAPRKNIVSIKSAGEKIVLGMTRSGVAMLMVNAGYTLAPFYDLAVAGDVVFYQTSVPDSGSQFRSRDYFPDAMAELAAHFAAQAKALGAAKISALLAEKKFGEILNGLSYIGEPLDNAAIPHLPGGCVSYVDNFGNIKLNYYHEDLLKLYKPGTMLTVALGNAVSEAVVGDTGFSQGEGVVAITSGSSGWNVAGKKRFFSEIFLRGGRAESHFQGFRNGDQVLAVSQSDLNTVLETLQKADRAMSEKLELHNASETRLLQMLSRAKLIKNGFDASPLQSALEDGSLLQKLGALS